MQLKIGAGDFIPSCGFWFISGFTTGVWRLPMLFMNHGGTLSHKSKPSAQQTAHHLTFGNAELSGRVLIAHASGAHHHQDYPFLSRQGIYFLANLRQDRWRY
jgi:hypothetical protein